jgi:hypothetical protein
MTGISDFNRIRYRQHDASVFLYAFDLIEIDGDDFRRDPLAVRKATLASLLSRRHRACALPSIWTKRTARSCSLTPARWGWRASYRSGAIRRTIQGAHRIG